MHDFRLVSENDHQRCSGKNNHRHQQTQETLSHQLRIAADHIQGLSQALHVATVLYQDVRACFGRLDQTVQKDAE